jgi:4-amino-4-deoxy-L-arabinose transferase-like glycosyltransferase
MAHYSSSASSVPSDSNSRILLFRWTVLGLLFLVALAIRLFRLDTPPIDFHPMRQYHSAFIARSYYYQMQENIPEWQREVAAMSAQREASLEPPILEAIAALSYRVAGGEHLWIPRLVSLLCWLIAGIFVYAIALKLGSFEGAVFSVAFFLLLPFTVEASRSFQPEPLMMMFMAIGIYFIILNAESPSLQRLIMSAVFSSLAILLKPTSVFFVYGAYISMLLYRNKDWRQFFDRDSLLFFTLSFLPALLFYGYGIFIAGYMRWKLQTSFIPQLLFDFDFWDGWLKRVRIVMGFTAFLGGFLSVLLFQKGWQKFLLLGLWASYFAYVFTFTYHVHTHDYYHVPLILIVALSLSSFATLISRQIRSESRGWFWQFLFWSTLFAAFVLSAGTSIQAKRKVTNVEGEIQIASTIGKIVNHSTQTIVLDEFDGMSLMYHGQFSGISWPHTYDIIDGQLWNEPELNAQQRFHELNKNNSMEYFIVTDLSELTEQVDLNDFLRSRFVILAENEDYLIFKLPNDLISGSQN